MTSHIMLGLTLVGLVLWGIAKKADLSTDCPADQPGCPGYYPPQGGWGVTVAGVPMPTSGGMCPGTPGCPGYVTPALSGWNV